MCALGVVYSSIKIVETYTAAIPNLPHKFTGQKNVVTYCSATLSG